MSAQIRTATVADRASVLALLRAQLDEHTLRPSDAALEFAVDRILEGPERGRILLAALDDETVGVAAVTFGWSFEQGGAEGWLDELYVVPAYRDAGIGALLVRAVRQLAKAERLGAIELEVEDGHERAGNLYQREGFHRHHRQRWVMDVPREVPSPPPAASAFTGGCLCGAVRYCAAAPAFDASHCHCSLCRRSTGAPFVTWATFPASSFSFTKGEPRQRKSSERAVRSFCGECGTALTFCEVARPNSVDVTVGSMDEPGTITPVDHTYTGSKLPWLLFADRLPRYEAVNPHETDCPGK